MARISLVFTSLFSKIKTTRPEHLKFQTPLETFIFAQDRILNNYFSRAPPPICMIGQLPHHFRNVFDGKFFTHKDPWLPQHPCGSPSRSGCFLPPFWPNAQPDISQLYMIDHSPTPWNVAWRTLSQGKGFQGWTGIPETLICGGGELTTPPPVITFHW